MARFSLEERKYEWQRNHRSMLIDRGNSKKGRKSGFMGIFIAIMIFAIIIMRPIAKLQNPTANDPSLGNNSIPSDVVIKNNVLTPVYPEFEDIAEVSRFATYIFYGRVVERKEAIEKKVTDTQGEKLYTLYTPVVVEIEEMIKGEMEIGENMVYMELGGVKGETGVEVKGVPPIYEDDRIFVLADKDGTGWGNWSVFQIHDNSIRVDNNMLPDLVEKSDKGKIALTLEQFKNLVKK